MTNTYIAPGDMDKDTILALLIKGFLLKKWVVDKLIQLQGILYLKYQKAT